MNYLIALTTVIVCASNEVLYEFDWINNLGPYLHV